MREIKFRGKRVDNGEWIYGVPTTKFGDERILVDGCLLFHDHAVVPESIGQYTGLKDNNGKKIYEGDILKLIDDVVFVFFNTATACFDIQYGGGDCESLYSNIEADIKMEVIGKIHDNPDLLK